MQTHLQTRGVPESDFITSIRNHSTWSANCFIDHLWHFLSRFLTSFKKGMMCEIFTSNFVCFLLRKYDGNAQTLPKPELARHPIGVKCAELQKSWEDPTRLVHTPLTEAMTADVTNQRATAQRSAILWIGKIRGFWIELPYFHRHY